MKQETTTATAFECRFSAGWHAAVALWRAGLTWEAITHRAALEYTWRAYYSRGMVAACEALAGWRDLATREAKEHGVAPREFEALFLALPK
jgi:hypothetical protein